MNLWFFADIKWYPVAEKLIAPPPRKLPIKFHEAPLFPSSISSRLRVFAVRLFLVSLNSSPPSTHLIGLRDCRVCRVCQVAVSGERLKIAGNSSRLPSLPRLPTVVGSLGDFDGPPLTGRPVERAEGAMSAQRSSRAGHGLDGRAAAALSGRSAARWGVVGGRMSKSGVECTCVWYQVARPNSMGELADFFGREEAQESRRGRRFFSEFSGSREGRSAIRFAF